MTKWNLFLGALSAFALQSVSAAVPLVMHLNRTAINPSPFVLDNGASGTNVALAVTENSPLFFEPRLVPTMTRVFQESPFTVYAAHFVVHANAGNSITVTILPTHNAFFLSGNGHPDSTPTPRIDSTQFSLGDSPYSGTVSFTMPASGEQEVNIGGRVRYFADTPVGLYTAPSNLQLRVTNNSTSEVATTPFNIQFSVLQSGHIQTVRNLVFSEELMTGIKRIQQVPSGPGQPSDAQFTFAPENGTLSVVNTTICLTRDGSTTSSCNCNNANDGKVQVSLTSGVVAERDSSFNTGVAYLGGNACYPANLSAGTYTGTGTLRMTFS